MDDMVHVRYMVNDVSKALAFYTGHLGFQVESDFSPAFGSVQRGNLRLLLAGPQSSAGRPMSDGALPGPGGWNRIHFVVPDLPSEVARLKSEGCEFRNEMISGPGGSQILLLDPSGNVIELFQPAGGWQRAVAPLAGLAAKAVRRRKKAGETANA